MVHKDEYQALLDNRGQLTAARAEIERLKTDHKFDPDAALDLLVAQGLAVEMAWLCEVAAAHEEFLRTNDDPYMEMTRHVARGNLALLARLIPDRPKEGG